MATNPTEVPVTGERVTYLAWDGRRWVLVGLLDLEHAGGGVDPARRCAVGLEDPEATTAGTATKRRHDNMYGASRQWRAVA